MIAPTPTDELTQPEPWLTMAEGAKYARRARPDGRPQDSFYNAVRRHLGERRKLVRRSELDRLIEEGVL